MKLLIPILSVLTLTSAFAQTRPRAAQPLPSLGLDVVLARLTSPSPRLIVWFLGHPSQGGQASCYGLMVSPKHVLTAAHCSPAWENPARFDIYLAGETDMRRAPLGSVDAEIPFGQEKFRDDQNDIAVIELGRAFSKLRPAHFANISFAASEGSGGPMGTRVLSLQNMPVSEQMVFFPHLERCNGTTFNGIEFRANMDQCGIQHGQSGAALTKDWTEKTLIMGVYNSILSSSGKDQVAFGPIWSVRRQLESIPEILVKWE